MQSDLALQAVEKQLEEVSSAILAGDPLALEKSSTQLRQVVADFSRLVDGKRGQPVSAERAQRIQQAGERLAVLRDNLARLTALVDRQVASVLPPADNAQTTYGKTGGRPGSAAARIYRSAG